MTTSRAGRYRPHLLALEPRMMFDAAAAAVAADALSDDAGHGPTDADHFGSPEPAAPDAVAHDPVPAREIIFIDTAVADYRQLAAEWAGRGEVVLIDATRDGVDQMRAVLAWRSDIAAIHIVSHGSAGVLELGTTRIDGAAITGDLAAALGAIGEALGPDGDILIYGCDFAEGTAGATALAAFARATDADVAASTDTTGYALRGGDWTLEAADGAVTAQTLDGGDWVHTLAPNVPVPIAVAADSLTVRSSGGTVIATGASGYDSDSRSADVGVGATATWVGAATVNGVSVDLRATIVSISSGDAVRFTRPTGAGANGDDPTFLLRDLSGGADDAFVELRWELIGTISGTPLPADVRFTIADIDGIGGDPNTRETVTASTQNLAYYTRERITDIAFSADLSSVAASGTQNENTDPLQPISSRSAATFDWRAVSAFTLTYRLTTNANATQAQFIHDGDADFVYTDPVYVSIPRLDLDGDDSTAAGTAALATFTENGTRVAIVGNDVVVTNPMPAEAITGATVRLTNWKTGDNFVVGTLPTGITATIGAVTGGTQTVTLSGTGSESGYAAALRAITFASSSDTPDTTQRVIEIGFANDTLTSATAISRITVVAVNDAPVAGADSASTVEDRAVTIAVLANDSDADGNALSVTAASALHGTVVRNADGTLNYTPTANYNGSDTISYTISDGNGGTASSTVAVRVAPQPDTPVNTVPAMQAITEDGAVTFSTANGNALTIADVDGGIQRVTITVTQGTFTLSRLSGLTFRVGDGTADTTMTFRGTIANINAALNGARFTAAPDANGAAQVMITTSVFPVEGEDFQNGDMEEPGVAINYSSFDESRVPGWETTAINGRIEVWVGGYMNVPAFDGRQFFEINGSEAASLYQEVRSVSGAAVTLDFAHRGRLGTDVMRLIATDLGADDLFGTADDVVLAQQDYSDGNTAWGQYTRQLTSAASGNRIRIDFASVNTANGDPTVGNFLDGVVLTQSGVVSNDSDSVPITITAVADIANDSATTAEDVPVILDVLANDSFENAARAISAIDGRAIVAGGSAVTVANGSVALGADARLTFTPSADYIGTTSFTYTVSSNGAAETATATITVTPVNDAPAAVGTLAPRTALDAAAVSIPTAGGFSDAEGDTLTYSATGLPAGLTIDAATGVISGTLTRSASQTGSGAYPVAVTARDPSNATRTQSFTLTVSNPAPIAVDDATTTLAEETSATITVLTNDSDPDGDPFTVTAASALHGTVVRNPDGTLTYTPDADYSGADTISYTISDGEGGTATAAAAVTVTPVNDAPTAVGTLPASNVVEAATVSIPTAGGFADPDGDTLSYSATGLPAWLTIDAATGIISGTPTRSASQAGGVYTVTVTARDPSNTARTQSFTLTVSNPAPIAVDDAITTLAEEASATIAVLTNDSDPDGDPLTVTAATALHGTVVRNPDGTLTYTPDADYSGADTISYAISDGEGGTATATAAVTVTPVNDAPTIAQPLTDRAVADGTTVAFATAGAFRDVDGDALTYSATGLPAGLSINAASGVVSGTVDHSASHVSGGRYPVAVTVRDPGGATVTTSFTLTASNPAPAAFDDRATARPGMPIEIAILANDADPDGDPLIVTAAAAANGTATINPDGTVRYTAKAGFVGADIIAYTIADGQGGTASAVVYVDVIEGAPSGGPIPDIAANDGQKFSLDASTRFDDPDGDRLSFTATGLPPGLSIDHTTGVIAGTIDRWASAANGGIYASVIIASDDFGGSVHETLYWAIANPRPTAVNDRAATGEDIAVTIAVLANDTDPDGDAIAPITVSAGHGAVAIQPDGTLRYTPAAHFSGVDTISYTIADAQGARATATVVVTVTPTDDAPRTAGLPRYDAADGAAVTIPTAPRFVDPDGQALTFAATGLPPGLAIDPATGVLSGTIASGSATSGPGGTGVFPVTVIATDPDGKATSATFDLVVAKAAPIARDDDATMREDVPLVIPVLANDGSGDPLTIVDAVAMHGSVAIDGDSLVFTPDRDFNGTATITYTVRDSSGARATATVMIVVTPTDDAPIARPVASQSSLDGQMVALDLGDVFADVDDDALTYEASGLPAGLSIDPATGRITGSIDRSASQVDQGLYHVVVTATANGRTASTGFAWVVTDPAPFARNDTARTDEDTSVVIAPLANDTDADGDPIRIVGATAAQGSVVIGADGRLIYTPAANFNGEDAILYTIDDGDGGRATAVVRITVDPVNDAPIAAAAETPVPAIAGKPVLITPPVPDDIDGDAVTVTGATAANGVVSVLPDGTIRFVADARFNGSATISYTIADDKGGSATGTIVVAVAPALGADVNQRLAIGGVHFRDPTPALATIFTADGVVRNPISLLGTVEAVRTLNATVIGDRPVGGAVNAIRALNGTSIDADAPVLGEVRRLEQLADRRDAGDRLFDHRWDDFAVRSLSGFSAAADRDASVMIESVVRGGAIYLDVRDIAEDGRAAIRRIDVRDARGDRPAWILADPRGLAIIERGADIDELHLVVRVTRDDGRTTATPIVVQGATGAVELDRPTRAQPAQGLDQTLITPETRYRDAAARLAASFE